MILTSSQTIAINRGQMPFPSIRRFNRVAVTGRPGVGKTTAVRRLQRRGITSGRTVVHCDDYTGAGWAGQIGAVLTALDGCARFIVEGVQVPRLLSSGLDVDAVVVLSGPTTKAKRGHRSMSKAISSTLASWARANPGVPIITARVRTDGN